MEKESEKKKNPPARCKTPPGPDDGTGSEVAVGVDGKQWTELKRVKSAFH
jgi:hypothetical protein